jgi:predicted metal-dependent hydrolase
MTHSPGYPPQYLAGIKHFNACEFYEAHDLWEELWADYRGPSREFYQGLIQVAVAVHHFGNGNIRGAKKLYHSSRKYLEGYRPSHLGCNIEQLFLEMEECFHQVLESAEEFPRIDMDPELIPEIHLDPVPLAAGTEQ